MATLMNTTTERLDALLRKHADVIDRSIDRYGLPLHVIFLEEIEANAQGFCGVLAKCYPNAVTAFAVKSNPCRGAVRAAAALGLGADVASENELRLALEEGIPPRRIICNGNAKSSRYLAMAMDAGCLIAVDNTDELHEIEAGPHTSASDVDILLRFRGMPLSGLTSDDQTTAADWTKFGFHIREAADLFTHLAECGRARLRGVSAHIGTQIAEPRGYERLLEHLLALTAQALTAGLSPDTIDIGGGFPVAFLSAAEWREFQARLLRRLQSKGSESVTWNDLPLGYQQIDSPSPRWVGKSYWSAVPQSHMLSHLLQHVFADGRSCLQRLHDLGAPRLIVEPGRALMATTGVTLTQVAGTKTVLGHKIVALDMGINNHGTNLISPDMFPAAVLPKTAEGEPIEAFLAGRLCFSGDMISKTKVQLNRLPRRGDRFVIYDTGAYGADHFASNSCGFLRPAKVAIRSNGQMEIWRAPELFEEIFGSPTDRLISEDAGTSSS
jgi:diaminopimelate decarboxylase